MSRYICMTSKHMLRPLLYVTHHTTHANSPAVPASWPKALRPALLTGCFSSFGTMPWNTCGRTPRITRKPSMLCAACCGESRPCSSDGTTLSTAPCAPPLNKTPKAAPAASRTAGSASHKAPCTGGRMSARCSVSWWRVTFSSSCGRGSKGRSQNGDIEAEMRCSCYIRIHSGKPGLPTARRNHTAGAASGNQSDFKNTQTQVCKLKGIRWLGTLSRPSATAEHSGRTCEKTGCVCAIKNRLRL